MQPHASSDAGDGRGPAHSFDGVGLLAAACACAALRLCWGNLVLCNADECMGPGGYAVCDNELQDRRSVVIRWEQGGVTTVPYDEDAVLCCNMVDCFNC